MIIEYETNIEEAIDNYIRLWWLQKITFRNLLISFIAFPLIWIFSGASYRWHLEKTLVNGGIISLIYSGYLFYAYGPGYRTKMKKYVLHILAGKPFPNKFRCEILDDGIIATTLYHDVKYSWKNIRKIQKYKNYIEFVGDGSLLQIREDKSPTIEKFIEIWKNT